MTVGTNLALAGNRSRLAGKSKRGLLVRPHELGASLRAGSSRKATRRGEACRKASRASYAARSQPVALGEERAACA